MMVQNSLLCAARTLFECAHRQEIESILCAARATSSARSAHRNRSVCVARTPPSTPRPCAVSRDAWDGARCASSDMP